MASAFAHAAAGAAIVTALRTPGMPRRLWLAGAFCAAAPDLDVLAFRFGVPYGHMLGHRGLTHSAAAAALLASGVLGAAYPRRRWPAARGRTWAALFLATASHGVLDALTTGGLGVAFLAPFSAERYFLPWRPILVSPIGVKPFFSARGAAVLLNEALWVGLPSALLAWVATRRRKTRGAPAVEA